jgi:phospholipid-binding lipoprotein MlaA
MILPLKPWYFHMHHIRSQIKLMILMLCTLTFLSACSSSSRKSNKQHAIEPQTSLVVADSANSQTSPNVSSGTLDEANQTVASEDDWDEEGILGQEIDYSKKDPWEKANRVLFNMHIGMDELTSKPAAKVYRKIMPVQGKKMIGNVLSNLWEPLRFIFGVLALDAKAAATASSRFIMNTTLGIGGLFDVAKEWKGLEKVRINGDQVLARYNIPEGPYVFIPYLGPSTLRGAIGYTADIFLDPFIYLIDAKYNYARMIVGYVHEREKFLDITDDIRKISVDSYAMTRSLYMQSRNNTLNMME